MTYMNTIAPPQVNITANIPVAPKPTPTMTWAEMAKLENAEMRAICGYAGSRGKAKAAEERREMDVIKFLRQSPQTAISRISENVPGTHIDVGKTVKRLVESGKLKSEILEVNGRPSTRYSLKEQPTSLQKAQTAKGAKV